MERVVNLGSAAPGQFKEKRIGGVTRSNEFARTTSPDLPERIYTGATCPTHPNEFTWAPSNELPK